MCQIYAEVKKDIRLSDCRFYHVFDIPEHQTGDMCCEWDLRGQADDYLGNFQFNGKRVLEIGPASGFLTYEMEKRGADVVALEKASMTFDCVPYPEECLNEARKVMDAGDFGSNVHNSFWYIYNYYSLRAKVFYGDAYDIPEDLGYFDVAVIANVLLHCKNPSRILEECAKRAKVLIVVEMYHKRLEGNPVIQLAPTKENMAFYTWWHFSTDFFRAFYRIMGFDNIRINYHSQKHVGQYPVIVEHPMFTIIGEKL